MYAQQWRDTLMAARKSYIQKNYEQSFKLYRSAKKLAPKEIDLSDEAGQSAYKAGKYEQAEKMYAQSSSNKGSAAQKGITQRQIGNARMKQEKYAEAIESYKESLRNNPKDEYARYNLAQAMKKKAQQDKKQQQQDQKDQQEKQNQQNKDQQNKQDKQQNNPGQKNQPENQKNQGGQENSQQKNQGEQPKDQPKPQQENRDQNPSGNNRNKLSDKKTERMLDKLMKQEMETKRKFDGVKSSGNTTHSGKDW